MGIIFSFLPSIERNTMCCVDPRRKQPCWVSEPTVHERYGGSYHVSPPQPYRPIPKKDNTPANEMEFNATTDVYAPVDTDAMLAQAGFGALEDRILRS